MKKAILLSIYKQEIYKQEIYKQERQSRIKRKTPHMDVIHQYKRCRKNRFDYAEARNKIKTLLRKAKRSFERGIALKSKSNTKIFWSYTRGNPKTKPGVVPLLANPNDNSSLKFDRRRDGQHSIKTIHQCL